LARQARRRLILARVGFVAIGILVVLAIAAIQVRRINAVRSAFAREVEASHVSDPSIPLVVLFAQPGCPRCDGCLERLLSTSGVGRDFRLYVVVVGDPDDPVADRVSVLVETLQRKSMTRSALGKVRMVLSAGRSSTTLTDLEENLSGIGLSTSDVLGMAEVVKQTIERNKHFVAQLGVAKTPTVLINGTTFITACPTEAELKRILKSTR